MLAAIWKMIQETRDFIRMDLDGDNGNMFFERLKILIPLE